MSATDRPPRSLEPLLAHPERAGVYHLPHSGSAQLEQATQDLGYAQYAVDLGDAADLDAALSEIGRALASCSPALSRATSSLSASVNRTGCPCGSLALAPQPACCKACGFCFDSYQRLPNNVSR